MPVVFDYEDEDEDIEEDWEGRGYSGLIPGLDQKWVR